MPSAKGLRETLSWFFYCFINKTKHRAKAQNLLPSQTTLLTDQPQQRATETHRCRSVGCPLARCAACAEVWGQTSNVCAPVTERHECASPGQSESMTSRGSVE